MKHDSTILKEYVRTVLREEIGDGGFYGSGGGATYGSKTGVVGMAKAFLHPFKVFIGKSKELGASIKNLGKISVSAIASLATLGIYKPDYGKLKETYKNEIKNIQSVYGPAYAETWRVLDRAGVTTAAFLYNPAAYLTIKHPNVVFRTALAVAGADWVAGALGLSATAGAGAAALAAFAAGSKLNKKNAAELKDKIVQNFSKLESKAKESASALGSNYRKAVDVFFTDANSKLQTLQRANTIDDLPISADQKNKLKKELEKSPDDQNKFLQLAKQSIAKQQITDLINHRNTYLGMSDAARSSDLYKRYTDEMNKIAQMFGVSSNRE